MAHTRQEIINKAEEAKGNMSQFYKSNLIKNLSCNGKTRDTGEYYTEVICEWLMDRISLFDSIQEIDRKDGYNTLTHDGVIKNPDSNRHEEILAMKMYNQSNMPLLGKVLDYQTPLKNVQDDKAGKIDLLAYNEDEKILRILELKKSDNDETMLRCVLEGYTYLKTVNTDTLLSSFKLPDKAAVKASPLVFYGGAQYKEMTEGRPKLEQLMKLLDCTPFYYAEESGKYDVCVK